MTFSFLSTPSTTTKLAPSFPLFIGEPQGDKILLLLLFLLKLLGVVGELSLLIFLFPEGDTDPFLYTPLVLTLTIEPLSPLLLPFS